MALFFVLWVRPLFESTTTLRFMGDQGPFGGASAAGVGEGGGGLSLLASLAGGSVPIQSEMSVLRSRSLAKIVVDRLGLRLELEQPKHMAWNDVFVDVVMTADVVEGDYELQAEGSGFSVQGEVLVARDPFRPIMNERREARDFGTVQPGQALPIPGMNVVLAESTAGLKRIAFTILPVADALDALQERVVVSKPEREADVVQITVQWTDPALAARIAEVLTVHFLERREILQAEQYGRTAGFLSVQLDSLNFELETAEERLKLYREEEGIVEPEAQATAAVEQLAEFQARRDLLVAERRALMQLVDVVEAAPMAGPQDESPYRRLVFFPTLLQNTATAELLRLMGELENERAELYGRRTEVSREASVITDRITNSRGNSARWRRPTSRVWTTKSNLSMRCWSTFPISSLGCLRSSWSTCVVGVRWRYSPSFTCSWRCVRRRQKSRQPARPGACALWTPRLWLSSRSGRSPPLHSRWLSLWV